MQAEGNVVRLPVAQEGPLDFATFFDDEHRGLFRLLCFVTGNREDAADLLQDAFLKLWERWHRVERMADPRAYLFPSLTVCEARISDGPIVFAIGDPITTAVPAPCRRPSLAFAFASTFNPCTLGGA